MTNAEIDELVYGAVRWNGTTVLRAIQDDANQKSACWLNERVVSASLRRLRSAGRVQNHDGSGTLARWRSVTPSKFKWWSTTEMLRRDYGYTDAELGLTGRNR